MRIFGILAVLLVLVVVGALAAPQFIDWNKYKPQIIEQIESNTGFEAEIAGDLDLAVLPMPRVVVNNLSVANPSEDKPFVTLDHADIYLDIMPLLSGNVSLKSITLNKPDISLKVSKDGTQNWMTEKLKGESSDEAAAEQAKSSSDVAIGALKIKEGRLSYTDEKSGSTQEIKNINGTFSMKSLKGPFDVSTSLEAMNMPLDVNIKTEALDSENSSVPANLKIGSKGAEVNFSGVIGYGEKLDAQGETAITIANLKTFLEKLTGQPQNEALDMPIKAKGIATLGEKNIEYTNLVAELGNKTLKGKASIEDYADYPQKPLQIKTELSGENNLLLNMNASLRPDMFRIFNAQYGYGASKASGAISFEFPQDNKKGLVDINMTSPLLNVDELMALSGQKKSSSKGGSIKESAAALNLPVNAVIKLSADKVIHEGKEIADVKVNGSLTGSKLSIDKVSLKNYAGATIDASGSIANIAELSGISLDAGLKTTDLETTLQALGQGETVKSLPTKVGAADIQAKLNGHLNSLAFDTKVDALEGTISAKGIAKNIETSPTFSDMVLGLKHPNLANLLQKIMPESERNAALASAVNINSQVNMDNNVYKLTALNGSFGPVSVNGDITADMSGKVPNISGSIKTGKLPLETFMDSSASGAGGGSASSGGKWSKDPIDTTWMNSANVSMKIASSEITYGGWKFDNPSFDFVMKSGSLNVNDWTAGLFGGKSDLNLQMTASPSLNVKTNLNLDNVGLQQLVIALAGAPVVQSQGVADFKTELSASGTSMAALISSLNGNGTVNGTDITVRGINVAEMARALSGAGSLGSQAKALFSSGIRGGTSKFETLDGAFTVSQGIATFQKLDLTGQDAVVATTGNVSLPAWTLDMKSSVQLIVPADQEAPPPFEITYRGSLSNPGSSFAQNALQGYLNKKLSSKANELIQDKLGDKLDGELGNVVGGLLGIKPKQQQQNEPAAGGEQAQEPANDNTQQQQQSSPYVPDSAKLQQQKEQKKDEPEEVLKDVLKGFLR